MISAAHNMFGGMFPRENFESTVQFDVYFDKILS